MKRKALVILWALVLLTASSCQPLVLAASESPDGKYRCEVYYGSPSFLWGFYSEKHRYYFNVLRVTPRSDLKKNQSFEYQTDMELQESDFKFQWSGQQVEVLIMRAGSPVSRMRGDFNEREQRWTRVE